MQYLRKATNAILGRGQGEDAESQDQIAAADQAALEAGEAEHEQVAASEEDLLNHCMPEEMQEEMFCFTMGDCELSELKPSQHGRQVKTCEFINASIHITQMPFVVDGSTYQMPCVIVTNDDYDEDQEQKQEEKLPLAENLIFMRYELAEEPDEICTEPGEIANMKTRIGYVFYYPEINECKIVECEPDKTKDLRSELE